MVEMTTNIPPYVRCGPDECQGHAYKPGHVMVLEYVLPHDLDDRAAETATALAVDVAMHYGTKIDGHQYEPGITVHKGTLTRPDGREWAATAVRSTA